MTHGRLLLVARGAGSFTPPYHPPYGAAWSAGTVWYSPAGGEPSAMYESGTYKMWANNGAVGSEAIVYWTSADGLSWSNQGTVLGGGTGGVAGAVHRCSVAKFGSTYYAYWVDSSGATANLKRSTSTDGTTWGSATTVLANNASANFTGWANSTVWQESGTWYMLLEGWNTSVSPATWRIALLSSADGLTWSFLNSGNPLTSLETYSGGSSGGPSVACVGNVQTPKFGGTYHLWFHGQSTSGPVPTPTYHTTSTDRINWTTPVQVFSGLPQAGHGWDQTSDPQVLVVGSTSFLYAGGVDNSNYSDNGGLVATG